MEILITDDNVSKMCLPESCRPKRRIVDALSKWTGRFCVQGSDTRESRHDFVVLSARVRDAALQDVFNFYRRGRHRWNS
jgi:hypothetical protein